MTDSDQYQAESKSAEKKKAITKKLFKDVMKGQWHQAVSTYITGDFEVRKAKITKTGDTVLHLAVSYGRTQSVLKMVQAIKDNEVSSTLTLKNQRGNTALHLAALLGDVPMCHSIASRDKMLITARNIENETPLFSAALRGNKAAFLYLQSVEQRVQQELNQKCTFYRRKGGDTILHASISGEYMDLAFQIINDCPELVNSVNKNGQSPLHILASKPNLFESSNHHFGLLDSLIYQCNNPHLMNSIIFLISCTVSVAAKIGEGVTEAVDKIYLAAVHEYLITDEKEKHLPVAAKIGLGVTEVVDKLLKTYPAAVHEYLITDEKEKHLPVAAKIGLGVTEAVDKLKTYLASVHEYFISSDKNVVCETPFLIAAKMGVAEVVEEILKVFPVAIQDLDSDNKNAVLMAVENRQPHVYGLLLKRELMKQCAFCQVDNQGNSALHLAAIAGGYRPWLTPGAALQMQWELKWYKFVKDSMPEHSFVTHNKKGQTPEGVFKETHQELIKDGTEWLTKTSESYSVVAALIATVAFSTSSSIPGGVDENSGKPKLGNEPAFHIFAISSVIALCCSVTALVLFLAILTSRFQEKNFATDLPRKLLLGLTSLFTSIASILISFCAGHFFILGDKVRNAAYPIYVATCLPVTLFALAQLPLYFDLIRAIVKKVPQRSYKEFPN